MKTLITTFANTIRAVKLLSDPTFARMLEEEARIKKYSKEAFYHRYYTVQVVN